MLFGKLLLAQLHYSCHWIFNTSNLISVLTSVFSLVQSLPAANADPDISRKPIPTKSPTTNTRNVDDYYDDGLLDSVA